MLKPVFCKYRGGNPLSDSIKGTYVLILYLGQDKEIVVGRQKSSSSILFKRDTMGTSVVLMDQAD